MLLERLKAAYKAFTMGSFAESRQEFDFILRAVPLVVGETRAEGNELKEVCYHTASTVIVGLLFVLYFVGWVGLGRVGLGLRGANFLRLVGWMVCLAGRSHLDDVVV